MGCTPSKDNTIQNPLQPGKPLCLWAESTAAHQQASLGFSWHLRPESPVRGHKVWTEAHFCCSSWSNFSSFTLLMWRQNMEVVTWYGSHLYMKATCLPDNQPKQPSKQLILPTTKTAGAVIASWGSLSQTAPASKWPFQWGKMMNQWNWGELMVIYHI